MTADVPRRLPRTQGQRVQNVARTHAAQSLGGATAAARPVTNTTPTPTIYKPPSGQNVVTGTGSADATSITSTTAGAGSSSADGAGAVAIGVGAVSAYQSVAVGLGSHIDASAGKAVAVGVGASVGANSFEAIAIGNVASAVGSDSICIGTANADGDNAVALGVNTDAGYSGAVAIGCDHFGVGAQATAVDDFVLGSANHHVIVHGGLILADSSGGLHRIVVSTGGALSTVAYP